MEIKDTAKFYKKNKYVLIKNFLSKEQADFIYNYGIIRRNRAAIMKQSKWKDYRPDIDGTFEDKQVPGTYSCYSDPMMETLLLQGLNGMRKITGLNLAPTYSYWRLYKNGDELKRHKDRPSCEVSTTLCLGYNNQNLKDKKKDWQKYSWPMWVDKTGGVSNKGVPIHMEPGDMIVYRGCEIEHWREKFLGNDHAQVFLHYNNLDGPYGTNCVYDGRYSLGLPPAFKDPKKLQAMAKADAELHKRRNK
tara:strand:- start:8097 stop:8837 length:741 start_codon:yes stop_codon:yes gene_type:complete